VSESKTMPSISSLQVIASKRSGGAETTFCRLNAALVERAQPTVAVVRCRSMLADTMPGNVPTQVMPMSSYVDLRTVHQLRALVRERGVDLVQSWMTRATWLTRVPKGCVHVARLGGYYRLRYFRHAHAWVVNTQGLRDWMLRAGFPVDRVEWISNFVVPPDASQPPPFSRQQIGVPEDALLIAAMGRLIPKKGFADLIRAFEGLDARAGGRPVHLMIMGRGPQTDELRALAAPMVDRVHFTGWVDNAITALPLADVFVCPSREEPYGNVMMEAWSLGLPVVSTRSDGGQELIEDRDNGLLCNVADPADLRRALRSVLEDDTLRQQIAGRGKEIFSQRHDQRRAVQAYLDFYERLRRRYG
jgi:glycosyltransferase involved in cell wall biosynthesis